MRLRTMTALEEVRLLRAQIGKIQKSCKHNFSYGNREPDFFTTKVDGVLLAQPLCATCALCDLQVQFNTWERCPKCFRDISTSSYYVTKDLKPYLNGNEINLYEKGIIKSCSCGCKILNKIDDR